MGGGIGRGGKETRERGKREGGGRSGIREGRGWGRKGEGKGKGEEEEG